METKDVIQEDNKEKEQTLVLPPPPQPLPSLCLFKYSSDNIIRQDDLVIFWEREDLQKQVIMTKGGQFQTRDGNYHFKNIINKVEFGSKIFNKNMRSYVIIMRPNSHMYTLSLMQRT